jgi:mannose-1-phosphate guanylyltransferase / mannose-6-phosphate isomerase
VTKKIIPVILSGGSGTRLWPLSRQHFPKQYLSLASKNTMLQDTVLRLKNLVGVEDPIVVCSSHHRFLVAEQLNQINVFDPKILLEPIGRNTAPAITVATIYARKFYKSDDFILLVLPADHLIQDNVAFLQTINKGIERALKGKLITFGVLPTDPNTNYGYIKINSKGEKNNYYKVQKFIEKPNIEKAKSYFHEGCYFWNSGIFMFQAKAYIKELSKYSGDILRDATNSLEKASYDFDFVRLDEKSFKSIASESIDYALMEKSTNVEVIPFNTFWSDLGSWIALYDVGVKDKSGNVTIGDVISEDTVNSYIHANHHMIATLGIKDLIVVDTANATLISTKKHLNKLHKVIAELQKEERIESSFHRKVYRPWGWYDSIDSGQNYQVKRLHVKPGAKLSLQLHHKRAEHWVVIKGVAIVTNGDDKITLNIGESTYIPSNVKHSLENITDTPLEIIEIQSGTYLGEDDIVRFDDKYGRV